MGYEECEVCGGGFISRGDWHKQCFTCFLKTPKGQAWKAGKDAEDQSDYERNKQEREAKSRRDENNWTKWRQQREQDERESARRGRRSGWDYSYEQPQQRSTTAGLDKDLLRKLIMLCHPDKHGGSEMSNSVTKELLKMKERLG